MYDVLSARTCAGWEEDGEEDGEGGGDVGDDLALAAVAGLVLADAVAGCCVLVEDVLCATDGWGRLNRCEQYNTNTRVASIQRNYWCVAHKTFTASQPDTL